MSTFHHHDPGTPESTWLLDEGWRGRPVVDLAASIAQRPRVVVAAAHPDDETLAVGGVVAAVAALGAEVVVLVATSGEGSHPRSGTWGHELLARTRRAEVVDAVGRLDERAQLVQLDHPDGGLASCESELSDALAGLVDGRTVLLAPWTGDGHCDHDALGRAAVTAAARSGALLAHYPLWLWHWGAPADFPWDRAMVVEPGIDALARKRRAIECYPSQTRPLGPLAGDEEVVPEAVLAHSRRTVEVLLTSDEGPTLPVERHGDAADRAAGGSAEHLTRDGDRAGGAIGGAVGGAYDSAAAPFDAMYDDGDDPWSSTSFYERRKFDLTLAALGRERYGRVLEIGCATGVLTRRLAERSDAVVGLDVSARALERARTLGGDERIDWVRGITPDDVPGGPFDLVVLSEVGYFLSPTRLLATLRRMRGVLADGGEIVLAHWQHPTSGIPLDGPLVHVQAADALDLPRRSHYRDDDVAIDVWGAPASVAHGTENE